jgi:hypothetical protein
MSDTVPVLPSPAAPPSNPLLGSVAAPLFCVCIPAYDKLHAGTEEDLMRLAKVVGDFDVHMEHENADIYQARSKLANTALQGAEDILLWIDSGHRFDPEDALMLVNAVASGEADLCTGIYPSKKGGLVCATPVRRGGIKFDGHLEPIISCGFGFVAVHRKAFELMQKDEEITDFAPFGWGYFWPHKREHLQLPGGYRSYPKPYWLGEDISFTERLYNLGGKLMLHTGCWPAHTVPVAMKWYHWLAREAPHEVIEVNFKEAVDIENKLDEVARKGGDIS